MVSGEFRAGDTVVLHLPMPLRTTRADPRVDAVRGAVAFERGPLVLCLESPDLPAGVDLNAVSVLPPADGSDDQGVVLRAARLGDAPWPYGGPQDVERVPVRAPLIPYASWGNRGPSTMRVWIPEERA